MQSPSSPADPMLPVPAQSRREMPPLRPPPVPQGSEALSAMYASRAKDLVVPPLLPALPQQESTKHDDSSLLILSPSDESTVDINSFAASFLMNAAVLFCLALITFGDVPRALPIAIVSTPVTEATFEEQPLDDSLVIEIPDEVVEAELIDLVSVVSVDNQAQHPTDLATGDIADMIPSLQSPDTAWSALADAGLLLASLGGDGDSGGRGGSGASFYGLSAKGQRFVFVTDCSSSMAGTPFAGLVRELHATIESLSEEAEFAIIFFNDGPILRSALPMEHATDAAKNDYLAWIAGMSPRGGTDPAEALAEALKLKPSVVFLLTDGRFASKPAWKAIRRYNRARRVQIHTIALGSQADISLLREIAQKNRGEFRVVQE